MDQTTAWDIGAQLGTFCFADHSYYGQGEQIQHHTEDDLVWGMAYRINPDHEAEVRAYLGEWLFDLTIVYLMLMI